MTTKHEYYRKERTYWNWKGKNQNEFQLCLGGFIISLLVFLNNISFYVYDVDWWNWNTVMPLHGMLSIVLTCFSFFGLFALIGVVNNFPKKEIIWKKLK